MYILALDQGTTSSRAIVFDQDSAIRGLAQREFGQIYPQSGWVEHDPGEIWQSQLGTARDALAQAGISAADLAAIGIANQRETTLVWERASGKPICNAIVWQDRRGAALCAELQAAGYGELFRRRTGLTLDPYFSASKLAWILEHVPDARSRAAAGELAFGTVDSWLVWQLTGGRVHASDVSNASRTLLFDIHRNCWDEELLGLWRIPPALLPQVHPSAWQYGLTEKSLLGAAVPIGGIAGDQQAALFGQACHAPGMAKNTYGTGCFMLLATGGAARTSTHGLITTAAAQLDAVPRYALEGSVFVGGAVVQWLRDGLGLIRNSTEVTALAESVADSGGVVFVPAFTGLGAPHWDPYARGGLLGLNRATSAAHIARAALAAAPLTELRVDGGAAANDLLLQFQADLLGIPVVRPQVLETTALGAAHLAGLTAGVWPGIAALENAWQLDRIFSPRMSRDEAAARMERWRDAVRRVSAWEQ
ncbi:MAG: glycerol kinase [Proteobacteria bacterium]|nr:glycerol kinase [Pseudomonadota bacterium]